MVVDTSAVIAILRDEADRADLVRALARAEDPVISAATLLEASVVMQAKTGEDGAHDLDSLLLTAGVRCVAVDERLVLIARTAWSRYGKGRAPAALNFGDCFSYALAKALDRPLLFTGEDFAETDVEVARAAGTAPARRRRSRHAGTRRRPG